MVYITNEEWKKQHEHRCNICGVYMSKPYHHRFVIGELVVKVPLCFEHYNLWGKNKLRKVVK